MPVVSPSTPLQLPAGMRATRAVLAMLDILPQQPMQGWTESTVESALQARGVVVNRVTVYRALDRFVQALFGPEVKTRLRPSYFPFTEPSVEVDVSCFECHGKGCPLCKHSGWIEVLGAGVVHRSVLENCGIDPEVYSGFAFGIGIERIAMLKYGINNIGLMFENDLRFLEQFKG